MQELMNEILEYVISKLRNEPTFKYLPEEEVISCFTQLAKVDKDPEKNLDGNRFLICLAIDLKHNHINCKCIIQIIENINLADSDHFLEQFDNLIHYNLTKYFVHSNSNPRHPHQQKYMTVMGWSRFYKKISKQLSKSGVVPLGLSDEKFIYDLFFNQKTITLADVEDWTGWKELTWLMPYENLSGEKQKVIDILDRLGLESLEGVGISDENDIAIYVEYPDDFKADCYQPTTLCGYWREGGGLYLSYKKEDGHGRTYSTTGGEHNTKEKVTNARKYSNGSFLLGKIGRQEGPLIKNRKKMIEHGYKRFKDEQ